MDGLNTAATSAPEVSTAAATPAPPSEALAPTVAAEPQPEQPQSTESRPAAETVPETESVTDFIKKGLSEIFATEQPAAETAEEEANTPEVVEGVTEVPIEIAEDTKPDNLEVADFVQGKFEILTDEQINEQFLRAPKGIREYAIAASREARAGRELTQKIGGEFFVEPLSKIAQGIQNGENLNIFHGILEAGGVDSFAEVLDDALQLALITTQQSEPTNEGERFLSQRCKEMVNQILETRFGENASIENIEKLLKYERDGYLNVSDVDSFYNDNKENEDNPLVKSLKSQVDTLQQQLNSQKTSETEQQNAQERAVTEKFTELSDSSLSKMMNDLVYKNSVIMPLEADSPEDKQAKATVKTLLDAFIGNKFKSDASFKVLQDSFKKGNQNTANFQTKFTNLIDTTISEARDLVSGIEAIFAAKISAGRNNQLLNGQTTPPGNPEQPLVPTQTAAPKAPAQMSEEEHHKWLRDQIAQL